MNGNNNLDFLMGNQGQNNYGNNYNNNYQNPMNQNMYGNNGYNNNYMNQDYNYNNDFGNDSYSSNERDYSNFDVRRLDDNNMNNNFNNGNNFNNFNDNFGNNGNSYNPINSTEDGNETLFGVPMYDEKKDDKKQDNSNLFLSNESSFNNDNPYQMNNFGGGYNNLDNMPPIMHNNQPEQRENEMLFGVPMYENSGSGNDAGDSNRTDIFGQLLTPAGNMRIKGGRIVDDFSKVNIPPQDGVLLPTQQANYMDNGMNNYNQPMNNQFGMNNFNQPMNNNQFGMNNYNQPMNNQFGMDNYNQPMNNQFGMNNYNQPMNNQFGMNNYGMNNYGMDNGMNNYNQPMNNQFGMNNYNQPMSNQFGMNNYNQPMNNFGLAPNNQYGMNNYNQVGGMAGFGMPMMPRPPVFNELKVEDNLNQKILSPEEIEAEENPDKKPEPRVDLDLEAGSKENSEELYE